MAKKIHATIDMVIRAKKMFEKAETKGWKKRGKFTKKNGSSYQCFQRGKAYIWIGFTFIERNDRAFAVDYVRSSHEKVEAILN